MSLSYEQMLDVMAYADGELAEGDVERVEKLIEETPEAKELFASLEALGDGVRGALDVASIDVRDAVMGKLRPNDIDKARLRRVARTRAAAVGVGILAIAAAVVFYVRNASQSPTAQNGTDQESALASASSTGVQVDLVETPAPISVFYVPANAPGGEQTSDTAPSVVVWVTDETAPSTEPAP